MYKFVEVENQEGGMGWYEYTEQSWNSASEAYAALAAAMSEWYGASSVENLSPLAKWYSRVSSTVVLYHGNLS